MSGRRPLGSLVGGRSEATRAALALSPIVRLVRRLFARAPEDLDAEFLRAVELSEWKKALKYIECGVDVNAETRAGFTALHLAAANGDIGLVGVLMRHGADVNARGIAGTPLHLAAAHGHTNVVRALLLYDGNPLLVDSDGNTAADVAVTADIQDLLQHEIRRLRRKYEDLSHGLGESKPSGG